MEAHDFSQYMSNDEKIVCGLNKMLQESRVYLEKQLPVILKPIQPKVAAVIKQAEDMKKQLETYNKEVTAQNKEVEEHLVHIKKTFASVDALYAAFLSKEEKLAKLNEIAPTDIGRLDYAESIAKDRPMAKLLMIIRGLECDKDVKSRVMDSFYKFKNGEQSLEEFIKMLQHVKQYIEFGKEIPTRDIVKELNEQIATITKEKAILLEEKTKTEQTIKQYNYLLSKKEAKVQEQDAELKKQQLEYVSLKQQLETATAQLQAAKDEQHTSSSLLSSSDEESHESDSDEGTSVIKAD